MAKQQTQEKEEQSAVGKLQDTIKKMQEKGPTDFERGVAAGLLDVHRRLIDEGWFGRSTFDSVFYQNRRNVGLDQKKEMPSVEGEQRETEGTAYQHDYSPDAFYGNNQDKAADQQNARDRDDDLGMER